MLKENFGKKVFNDQVMKDRLPLDIYKAVKKTRTEGKSFGKEVAAVVANAMKQWAIEQGATHFTHWFQPLTGQTAEKHDAFLTPDKDREPLTRFSANELIRGESDASSFPSGGLRSTFEARGYTTWDPSSFAFVKGSVLYIPTAFAAYNGEAMDLKTPLLRSMETLSIEAMKILKMFGNNSAKRVTSFVGAEQEYFLVDKKDYEARIDLVNCQRTLLGALPAKMQQLDDHYYANIEPRILAFMEELDESLWELGVFAKTRHNEVAPAQHELANVYDVCNIAVDQNQLTMEELRRIAKKHGFYCLLHEKPFAGINGSGKHNNYSLATDDGVNLLDPGDTPSENTQFLLFLLAIIKACDEHQDLLRISVAGASNDHRLGAQEAPPAIISIYLGQDLHQLLSDYEKGEFYQSNCGIIFEGSARVLPHFFKDTTDRNRTSPFAFTGNKFEFRMPGSNQSVAEPNIVLNTIIADALEEFNHELEAYEPASSAFFQACQQLIRREIAAHKRILFTGNNYTEDWASEAEQRGLLNLKTSVDALPYLRSEANAKLFYHHKVYLKNELAASCDVHLKQYCNTVAIEAATLTQMVKQQVIPAVLEYERDLGSLLLQKQQLAQLLPAGCGGAGCGDPGNDYPGGAGDRIVVDDDRVAYEENACSGGGAASTGTQATDDAPVNHLAANARNEHNLLATDTYLLNLYRDICYLRQDLQIKLQDLETLQAKAARAEQSASVFEELLNAARIYCDEILPAMSAVRVPADKLEELCPASLWPLPTYQMILSR